MFDYYLSFNSEEEANKVLQLYVEDPINYCIDIIGIIYKDIDTGALDENEQPIYRKERLEGFKVNLRSRKELDLKDFEVFPDNPARKFA